MCVCQHWQDNIDAGRERESVNISQNEQVSWNLVSFTASTSTLSARYLARYHGLASRLRLNIDNHDANLNKSIDSSNTCLNSLALPLSLPLPSFPAVPRHHRSVVPAASERASATRAKVVLFAFPPSPCLLRFRGAALPRQLGVSTKQANHSDHYALHWTERGRRRGEEERKLSNVCVCVCVEHKHHQHGYGEAMIMLTNFLLPQLMMMACHRPPVLCVFVCLQVSDCGMR